MKITINWLWLWFLDLACHTAVKPQIPLRRSTIQLQAERHSVVVSLPFNTKTQRVDAYLATIAGGNISRSAFGQLCENGKVFVNERVGKKNSKVCNGDRIDYEARYTMISVISLKNITHLLFTKTITINCICNCFTNILR